MEEERDREGSAAITRALLNNEDEHSDPTIEEEDNSSITLSLLLSTFIAVCGSYCYGAALGYSSPAESGIMEDLGLSIAEYSIFGSIMTLGGMVGAISSGKIADLFGRRRTMWLSQICCTPGWLAITFAKNAWWLYTGRLLIGVGVGLITYVVPVYIAEISVKKSRGRFMCAHQVMQGISFAFDFFAGNFIPWRTLALIVVIPCIVQIIGLFFIPESPRWLAKCGREKEFEASLQQLRGSKADISQEAIHIKEIIETFDRNSSENGPLVLFQRRYAYPIFIGVGLMLLQQLGGDAGISYYVTSIFRKAGFSTTIGTTAISILNVPMSLVALSLMDLYGRKTLLLASSIGTSIFLLLVAFSFYLQEHNTLNEITPTIIFVCLLLYYASFVIGLAGVPWVLMSEILPINIKAIGGSLVTLTNWSTSWLVTLTVNFAMEWSIVGTFCFFGVICALSAVFALKFVPETKGRTLEEIQAEITHHSSSNSC